MELCKEDKPTNPEYWYSVLVKCSIIRKASAENRYDIAEAFLKSFTDDETNEKYYEWNDWFSKTDLTAVSKKLSELNQCKVDSDHELIKICRGVQLGFSKPKELPRAEKKQEWLVDGMILADSFVEIIAPQKARKSQLGYQLAGCVQNGIDFLGRKTKKKSVVYIDYEMEPNEIYARSENLKQFLNIPDYDDFRVMSLSKDADTSLDTVLYLIREEKKRTPELNLVVFDNFYSFCEGDTNNVADVKAILKRIFQGVGEGITVVVINHTNKEVSRNKKKKIQYYDILTAAFGSNVHGMFASDIIYIEPKSDGRVVWAAGRHISPELEIPCFYEAKTNWFFLPDLAAKSREGFHLNDEQIAEIDEYLEDGSKQWRYFHAKFPYDEKVVTNSGYVVETPVGKHDRYIRKL